MNVFFSPFTYIAYLTFMILLLALHGCSNESNTSKNQDTALAQYIVQEEDDVVTHKDNNATTNIQEEINSTEIQETNDTIENQTKEFPWEHGRLKVSSDGHFLQHENGLAFFWMADTAWQLVQKLNLEEIETYFTNRKNKRFSVIMITVGEHQGVKNRHINAYAFDDFSYLTPNEEYFEYLDKIIDLAASKGLYIGLLPAWNMFLDDDREYKGLTSKSEAKTYGEWIAKRYKEKKNIIWIIGGDSTAYDEKKRGIWNAMGNAIDTVVGDSHLITYHPTGTVSSSTWFHDEEWLDFNMIQSGHCADISVGVENLRKDYDEIKPTKPTIDAEPRYETIKECFYKENHPRPEYRFNANDVREVAYKQIFSGAFGHTYGHHSIWQMSLGKNDGPNVSGINSTVNSWQEALDAKGAKEMSHIVKLMKSRPILGRIPAQSILKEGDDAYATKGEGYVYVYLPKGGSVTLKLGSISGDILRASWFDPRTGTTKVIDEQVENSGIKTFDTESAEDMVLILDDKSKDYTLNI